MGHGGGGGKVFGGIGSQWNALSTEPARLLRGSETRFNPFFAWKRGGVLYLYLVMVLYIGGACPQ